MNRVYRILIVYALTALGLISAPNAWAAERNLLIVGDSLSAAYGIASEDSWVSLLEEQLKADHSGWEVANASISGDTTDSGLRRLPPLLKKHRPDIVIVELGGNDGLRGFPPPITKNNLAMMIEKSEEHGAEVLLVGIQLPPNFGPRYTQAFADIYPRLAQQHDVALVPFMLEDIYQRDGMMQKDGIHPTAKAQPLVLDNVWKQLEHMLN
ncbi:arylesterase [gamma proteobacterium HTCC5015]|nr:arylesterase [gamma proteobacterium HTCC5015]